MAAAAAVCVFSATLLLVVVVMIEVWGALVGAKQYQIASSGVRNEAVKLVATTGGALTMGNRFVAAVWQRLVLRKQADLPRHLD